MEGCIEAMADALSSLARGEVHVPLRAVVQPPGGGHLHRADAGAPRRRRAALLAEDGLRLSRQPASAAWTRTRGRSRSSTVRRARRAAIMNASAITAIRTAAVSAVATRLLAREDARELGILGAGVQARSHLEALRLVRDFDRVRIYAPTAAHARGARGRGRGRGGRAAPRKRCEAPTSSSPRRAPWIPCSIASG